MGMSARTIKYDIEISDVNITGARKTYLDIPHYCPSGRTDNPGLSIVRILGLLISHKPHFIPSAPKRSRYSQRSPQLAHFPRTYRALPQNYRASPQIPQRPPAAPPKYRTICQRTPRNSRTSPHVPKTSTEIHALSLQIARRFHRSKHTSPTKPPNIARNYPTLPAHPAHFPRNPRTLHTDHPKITQNATHIPRISSTYSDRLSRFLLIPRTISRNSRTAFALPHIFAASIAIPTPGFLALQQTDARPTADPLGRCAKTTRSGETVTCLQVPK